MSSTPEDVPTEDGVYRAAGGIGAIIIREDGIWIDGNGNELALTFVEGAQYNPPRAALEFLTPPFTRLVPAGEAEAEAERIKTILDQHLPTVITGLHHLVFKTGNSDKAVAELTEDEVAMRAALSASHWIAKGIASNGGESLYDLPSVLDLMQLFKRERAKVAELENPADASERPSTPRDRHASQGYKTRN